MLHVDGARIKHSLEIDEVIAIFAGGNIHACRRPVANQAKTLEIIRGHWFLERCHAETGELLRHLQRLLSRICSVGVDVERRIAANRLASRLHARKILARVAANLHLYSLNSLLHPPT